MVHAKVIWSTILLLLGGQAAIPPFDEDHYYQYILFDWDDTDLVVHIEPDVSTDTELATAALEDSVAAWNEAIEAYAAPWLQTSFEMRSYVVGRDLIPVEDAIPDIIAHVVERHDSKILGIGNPSDYWCNYAFEATDENGLDLDPAKCDLADHTCVATNTVEFIDYDVVYNLNAHEFGHCLGIGHVGDAGDFHAPATPDEDVMSYDVFGDKNCVSNLNILSIEGTFAVAAGLSSGLDYGDFVEAAVSDYEQYPC